MFKFNYYTEPYAKQKAVQNLLDKCLNNRHLLMSTDCTHVEESACLCSIDGMDVPNGDWQKEISEFDNPFDDGSVFVVGVIDNEDHLVIETELTEYSGRLETTIWLVDDEGNKIYPNIPWNELPKDI